MIRVVRVLVLALGIGLTVHGVRLMAEEGLDNFGDTAIWLVAGVVLHDAVIGPAVILLAVLASRLFRGRVPAPVVIGGIVLGSVTLAVVPMLGRYGALPDNPTLLPRDYAAGWLGFAGLILLAVATATLVGRRSTKGGGDGARSGR